MRITETISVVLLASALSACAGAPAEDGLEQQLGQSDRDAERGRHRDRSAVYVVANPFGEFPNGGPNAVAAFTRDPRTGLVTDKGRYLTGGLADPFIGGFTSHSLVSNGRLLFAVNPGDDTVTSFAIRRDGSLVRVGQAPSGGRRPASLAVHGDLLYVANQGNLPGIPPAEAGSYSGLRIHPDGTLSPIPGSVVPVNPFDSPAEILINKSGTRLVASRIVGGAIDSFRIRPDGRLDQRTSLGGLDAPFGGVFSPQNQTQVLISLVAALPGQVPSVASYRIAGSGAPTELSKVADPTLIDPCWLSITPDGRRLWSSSFIPRTLALFSVGHNGDLTQLSSNIPPDEGPGSTDIDIDPAGRYVYRLRAFEPPAGANPIVPRIEVLRVTASNENGGLQLIQSLQVPDLEFSGLMGMLVVDL